MIYSWSQICLTAPVYGQIWDPMILIIFIHSLIDIALFTLHSQIFGQWLILL